MPQPPRQAQKKFTPVRPLLNQPPLNIENLPTRIQKGECEVLPPKFCSPMSLPPICPPSACQPCYPPPCTAFCIPRSACMPNCCYPNPCSPCSPCTPVPPSMCCPPPCPPVFMCPPPCSPFPCTPCMPSPPPPPCCPPPPCPPPPCQPCVPQSDCCGSGNSCCSGQKQIICIPKRAQAMAGACGNQLRRPSVSKTCPSEIKHGLSDQPASYNNCNFYLAEIPKSLRDKFGMSSFGDKERESRKEINKEMDDECEDDHRDECYAGEENCQDLINGAAGDDQIIHPPVGYPGSQRSPWGAGGFPGLTDGTEDGKRNRGGFGDENGTGNRGGYGDDNGTAGRGNRGGYGDDNGTGGRGNRGGYGDDNGTGGRGNRGYTGGRGESGKGRNSGSSGSNGRAERNQRGIGASRGPNSANGNNGGRMTGNKFGTTTGGRQVATNLTVSTRGGDQYESDPYGNDPYGRNQSRNGTGGRVNNDPNARFNYQSTAKSEQSNKKPYVGNPSTTGNVYPSDPSSRALSRALSGYRPYSYSNAELTQKSTAYLPENYDVPTPHELDQSVHPSRAPITPYTTYNLTFEPSKSTEKPGFEYTPPQTKSQATMKPSCSSVRSTRNAYTTTYRPGPSNKSTAVPSSHFVHTTGVGSTANSSNHHTSTNTDQYDPSNKSTFTSAGPSAVPSTHNTSTNTHHLYDPSNKSTFTSIGPSGVPSAHHTNNNTLHQYDPSNKSNFTSAGPSTVPSAHHTNNNNTLHQYDPSNKSTFTSIGPSSIPSAHYTSTNSHQNKTVFNVIGQSAVPSPYHATYQANKATLATPRFNHSAKSATIPPTTNNTAPTKFNKHATGNGVNRSVGVPSHQKSGTTRAHSEPNLSSRRSSKDVEVNLDPQRDLYDIDESDDPSLHVLHKPVRKVYNQRRIEIQAGSQQNSRANLDVHEDDLINGNKNKIQTTTVDPCNVPRTCLKYHTRRMHRLCSFSNRRGRRLSEIHKPKFHFKKPPCPIRETNASILRKVPPNTCRWHNNHMPAFHEYCMTDHCAEKNRYPLLTRELSLSPLCDEDQHISPSNHRTPGPRHAERRGTKRKNHQR